MQINIRHVFIENIVRLLGFRLSRKEMSIITRMSQDAILKFLS